ncbi:MAG: UDP-2,3-diacylglucosamine diphosphatase [Granulosicoccus sp.]
MNHTSTLCSSTEQGQRCLFIADLHLAPESPVVWDLALNFFEYAQKAQQLFILGDLFEYWIGDDDGLVQYRPIIEALHQLTESGCKVTVMHGNRDFLLGDSFAKSSGVRLERADEIKITLADSAFLLMHGDTLCIDDKDYIAFRHVVRSTLWQNDFLRETLQQRRLKAEELRAASMAAGIGKSSSIMDVNIDQVERRMIAKQCESLIHGHTHRPNVHSLATGSGRRYVVGDWHSDHAQYLCFDGQQLLMQTFRR